MQSNSFKLSRLFILNHFTRNNSEGKLYQNHLGNKIKMDKVGKLAFTVNIFKILDH